VFLGSVDTVSNRTLYTVRSYGNNVTAFNEFDYNAHEDQIKVGVIDAAAHS